MSYRPEFEAALHLFAKITTAIEKQGGAAPILVGGAAVELYSASAIATGDFDVVTPQQEIFERVLQEHGFIRPSGPGVATRGWIHPELRLGFEVVSAVLLDGKAQRDRVQRFDVADGEHFSVIAVEDLIADRMGQYHSGTAAEMLGQAQALFRLYRDADIGYLEGRIREETDEDYGVANLEP